MREHKIVYIFNVHFSLCNIHFKFDCIYLIWPPLCNVFFDIIL